MLDDPNKKNNDAFPQGVRCQKCLQCGHWSYQCTNKRAYVKRETCMQQMRKKMKTLEKLQKSKSVEHVNGNGNGNDTTLSPAATSQQLDEPVTKDDITTGKPIDSEIVSVSSGGSEDTASSSSSEADSSDSESTSSNDGDDNGDNDDDDDDDNDSSDSDDDKKSSSSESSSTTS